MTNAHPVEHGMTARIRNLANHVGLLLVARLAAAIGVPVAVGVLAYAASGFMELRDDVQEMAAFLRWSVEPRLAATEREIATLKLDEARQIGERFSRNDARELEAAFRRDLARIEAQVADLRQRIDAVRQSAEQ